MAIALWIFGGMVALGVVFYILAAAIDVKNDERIGYLLLMLEIVGLIIGAFGVLGLIGCGLVMLWRHGF